MLAKVFLFRGRRLVSVAATTFFFLSLPATAHSQAPNADLTQMNIEDLMKVEVTSVSRHEQSLSQTAAAVFVISDEDILRSSATSVPELLRMVPGVQVAQMSASSWAISVRGFNNRFSNKVLVMVDGRTVYDPSFAGVFYEALDVPLEQIARIEVIRGPGGSIWGTNAVNGVINIITKKAVATPGITIVAGVGNIGRGFGLLQGGGKLRSIGDFRVFTNYSTEGSQHEQDGPLEGDGWHILHGGFRSDSKISSKDTLSVQADIYSGREGGSAQVITSFAQPPSPNVHTEVNISGGSFQGSWNHTYSERSDSTLMVSYQRYARTDVINERRGTLDLDFQHNLSFGERQKLNWGFAYRYSSAHTEGTFAYALVPPDRDANLYSGFLQDQITLVPKQLTLTGGIKLEHHYYSGFGAMPSARIAWTPSAKSTCWAAVSRALRSPSDLDDGMRVISAVLPGPGGMPVAVLNIGNPRLQNESLLAYEAGYRSLLRKNLSFDLATYYHSYHKLQTWEPEAPSFEDTPAPLHLVMPFIAGNLMQGEAHGLEVFANWHVLPRWTLSPGYAFERLHLHLDPGSQDISTIRYIGGSTPAHSAQLGSHVALPRHFSWDTSLYFVDRLASPQVVSYTRLDSKLTWHSKEHLSLTVAGQNLLQDHHLEFQDLAATLNSSLMKRSAYAKITWHF